MKNESQTKTCQSCKKDFVIEPEDFAFYAKIEVPPPTFCPTCRLQRRLAFWNMYALYMRECDLCKKKVMSMYPPEAECVVYCPPCWYSDNWSPLDYGRDYDFSRPFFEQLLEQWKRVPLLGLSMGPDDFTTSPHNNQSGFLKDCYLLFDSSYDENCAYGTTMISSRDCYDCTLVAEAELCYDSVNVFRSHECFGCNNVGDSLNSFFLRDCKNCQNCFGSTNLRNAKYVMFNKQLSKEEYEKRLAEFNLGSYDGYRNARERSLSHWKTTPPMPDRSMKSVDCSGLDVIESKNCKQCSMVFRVIDSKYIFDTGDLKDSYDVSNFGQGGSSLLYECGVVGIEAASVFFSQEAGLGLHDAQYCKLSMGASNHFACVSVRKTPYCIFNKQYKPDEWSALRDKIIAHMNETPYTDAQGNVYRYGEFFPMEFNRHPYNDTIAHDVFPLTPDEIAARKLWYRKPNDSEHKPTLLAGDIPNDIKEASDSVLKEIISCSDCSRGYRIIPKELTFLRKMNLPLPRRCPMCRIKEKHQLWLRSLRGMTRTCDKCGVEFKTAYSEKEAPTILCRACYTATVA